MKKAPGKRRRALRAEYDLSSLRGGKRGRYLKRFRAATNLILLEPDVSKAFPDGEAVNEALRVLIKVAKRSRPKKRKR